MTCGMRSISWYQLCRKMKANASFYYFTTQVDTQLLYYSSRTRTRELVLEYEFVSTSSWRVAAPQRGPMSACGRDEAATLLLEYNYFTTRVHLLYYSSTAYM